MFYTISCKIISVHCNYGFQWEHLQWEWNSNFGLKCNGIYNHVIEEQFCCNNKENKIFGQGTDCQEKRRWHGRRKKTSAPEDRRLKMLSMLGRLKTTSELSFD